jgi:glutaminase
MDHLKLGACVKSGSQFRRAEEVVPKVIDYHNILGVIHRDIGPVLARGQVIQYIPALANIPLSKFGMALYTVEGEVYKVGDAEEPFSIQSISKVFALALAFQLLGDDIWHRVGRAPSGTAFNSLSHLEREHGVPRNPFVNAGALVITDLLCSRLSPVETAVVQFVRQLSANPTIGYDLAVATSEREQTPFNVAAAHLMSGLGNLRNGVDQVIGAYCRQCAIAMNCVDLARAVSFLSNEGVMPWSRERVLDQDRTKCLNALMLTCGTYDAAGEFLYRVGLPAKSGVGGGIVAVLPRVMGICVWSPGLDGHATSLAGTQALEWLTRLTGRSIF